MEEKKHCKWYNDEFCTNDKSPCVADYCPCVEYPELCKCRELDKDINVRSKDDTDIVDGMFDEAVIDTLKEMTVKHSNDSYVYRVLVNAINLIHRLQSENAGLQKRIEEQRKIIEYQDSVEDRNAELQKQVDELKKPINGKFKDNNALQKAYESLEKEFTRKSQKLRKLQDENAVYKQAIDSEREPYHLGFEHGKEQAVKDTAKEILDMFDDRNYISESELKKAIAERYGVGVE